MDAFSDLSFFSLLMKHGSLTATAQDMGVTPPSVSKRLAALEARLGVRLLNRTTRRASLTPEGETYLTQGARVLADLDALERTVAGARAPSEKKTLIWWINPCSGSIVYKVVYNGRWAFHADPALSGTPECI